jgi:hypothetical protein
MHRGMKFQEDSLCIGRSHNPLPQPRRRLTGHSQVLYNDTGLCDFCNRIALFVNDNAIGKIGIVLTMLYRL